FVPLATGGRLVLGSPGCERDPAVLARDLAERRIDNLVMVPTMANLLLQEPGLEGATGLKRLLCGGEIVSAELVANFAASPLRHIDLFNIYGPTEACVLITAGRCNLDSSTASTVSEVVVDGGSLAIGRPLANTRTYSLDQRLDPVAIGAPGELFIGGVCLAAGYLEAPRQTAVTYLPDPFSRRSGERLYRTGDLVRSLADGRWLFLRRCDRQIKLRGVRIEPGEIEAALRAHPAIRGGVVTVQTPQAAAGDPSAGGRQDPAARLLVAWLEGTGQDQPDNESLRSFLEKSLPPTLVPSSFQWLEALPLTASGKVDRGALAHRPLILDGPREDTSRLPRSATEEILLGVWTDVLQSSVGLKDNFFDLGGHSLLATQVASRAANLFDLPIGPRWLFEQPTVAEMAAEIDRERRGERTAAGEPIRPIARDQTLPLSFAQERMWFLDQFSAGGNSYASLAPLRFRGPLHASALRRAFDHLVARHEVLRTTFASSGSEAHQVISACCDHPLPLIDLTRLGAEPTRRRELARHIGAAHRQPYDLVRGPLFRTQLLRLAEDDHVVLLGNHHAVFDGWSMDILVRELGELYNAAVGGRPAALPPLPIQYADFAAWQRQRLHGEALEEQLSFWRQTLGETTEAGLLPVDRPRDANSTSRAAHRTFTLSAATSQALRELSRQRGTTLFMTLLAALQALLQRHTGAAKVVVGTPIANRHHEAIEGLIGFFVNTLAIPADFHDRPSFATLLERAREAALGAYAHQDLPFEKLVEELRPERRNSTQSLFQVLFTFQNVPQEPVDLDDLQLEPLTADDGPNEGGGSHPAIFELSLVMAETAESLAGDFEYDAALFEPATMEGFVGRFERLLDAVAADPEQPLADITLFAEDEEQRWLRAAAERLAQEAAPTRPATNAGDPLADEKRSESKLRAKVSGRRDDLSDAKRALLARRLRGRKKPSPESIPQGVGD
ncbi:MAG: condensation domain-containing protein, partial [Acidobacteriota bacterium]